MIRKIWSLGRMPSQNNSMSLMSVRQRALLTSHRTQVDSKAAEAKEKLGRLDDLKTQLASLSSIKSGHETAISLARSKCDEYTKSDVTKLKRESGSSPVLVGSVEGLLT